MHLSRDKSGQVAPPSGQAGPCSPPLCGQPTREGERRTLRGCHTGRKSSHITAFLGDKPPSQQTPAHPASGGCGVRQQHPGNPPRRTPELRGLLTPQEREASGTGAQGAQSQEWTLPVKWEQHLRRGQHLGMSGYSVFFKALLTTLLRTHRAAGGAGAGGTKDIGLKVV